MDSNQGSYPNALGLFNESVITTFRNVSDIMPSGREKYIHSVGAVAKFTFNPAPSTPFTGVFGEQSGGLLRVSFAKAPASDNITPGFGIKFLRNNRLSCNFMAMPSLDGQSDMNPFALNFTNHPALPKAWALKLVALKFTQASNCPLLIGLSDCAT